MKITVCKMTACLVSLFVFAAASGCTGPAYDSAQSGDSPVDAPADQEQDSNLKIDVGEEGVNVEVGEGVDIELSTDGDLNVDVNSNDDAAAETPNDGG